MFVRQDQSVCIKVFLRSLRAFCFVIVPIWLSIAVQVIDWQQEMTDNVLMGSLHFGHYSLLLTQLHATGLSTSQHIGVNISLCPCP